MAEIKLTKNELRKQQKKLEQLQKYLPILQLKKGMLQEEVLHAKIEIRTLETREKEFFSEISLFSKLFRPNENDIHKATRIQKVIKRTEKCAGIEIPVLEEVLFEPFSYSLFETPPWFESAFSKIRAWIVLKESLIAAQEKKRLLEKELKEVSIRVNLFEKILIRETVHHIKKITIFLGDQDLAAISRAKIAKRNIEKRKGERECALM